MNFFDLRVDLTRLRILIWEYQPKIATEIQRYTEHLNDFHDTVAKVGIKPRLLP